MKKLRRMPILCFFVFNMAGLTAQQSTLHLITCIDNINSDIKAGCAKDYNKATIVFGAIAQDAGMQFNNLRTQFNLNSLSSTLENFQCGSNDVVIFLFSGHGFKYEDDDEELRWPILFTCKRDINPYDDDSGSCELDLDMVQQYLQNAGPRLSITLGDCCNEVIGNASVNATYINAIEDHEEEETHSNLALFTNDWGHIIASAASPGEAGNTTDEDGSNFSNAFLKLVYDAVQPNAASTSWERIFSQTKAVVKQAEPGQTPQSWIQR